MLLSKQELLSFCQSACSHVKLTSALSLWFFKTKGLNQNRENIELEFIYINYFYISFSEKNKRQKMRVRQDIKHLANCRVEVDESKLLALVTLEMWISSVNPFFLWKQDCSDETRRLEKSTFQTHQGSSFAYFKFKLMYLANSCLTKCQFFSFWIVSLPLSIFVFKLTGGGRQIKR